MNPRITVITFGVANLERAVAFYRDGLGFPTKGPIGGTDHSAVAFFDLENGIRLGIWSREDIARDATIPMGGKSPTEFTIGHNVRTKAEVDSVMREAREAGATITKPAGDTFLGGYAGYFKDPDGHLWEIVWDPELLPED